MKNQKRTKPIRLKLRRPIAIIDLETTGTAPDIDRIVEIGILKVRPDGKAFRFKKRVKPGIRIPIEAIRVHGIKNEHVADKPRFRAVAPKVKKIIGDCDLAGFNLKNFDLPMLFAEFGRAGMKFSHDGCHIIDVKEIYHHYETRTLSDAVRFYCGRKHGDAHSALDDARATWKVLKAQVKRYKLPRSVSKLADFMQEERSSGYLDSDRWFTLRDGKPFFAKGKHKGLSLSKVAKNEPDYLQWMLETANIPVDTQEIVQKAFVALNTNFAARMKSGKVQV